jgi:hypothetical protein
MLKTSLFISAIIVLAVTAGLLLVGLVLPGLFVFAVWAAIAALGLAFERFRYKPVLDAPQGEGWERTDERFVDPSTGETLTVYYHPATGKRAYVR